MDRTSRLLLTAKAVRTFSYGALSVVFPVYLEELGLGPRGIGLSFTLTLAASAAFTFAVRAPARRFGARPILLALSAVGAAGAILFLAAEKPWQAITAAMLANLAVGAGETGPFLTLEQTCLARTTSTERLGSAMSVYNFVGYAAAAGGAAVVGRRLVDARAAFLLLLAAAALQLGIYAALRLKAAPPAAPVSGQSSALIRRLAALFALDSFAGGFVVQSLVLYWLRQRFELELAQLGWVAFGAQMLSGLSFLAAPALSRRWGLVNTMVFSHLAANLLLIGVGLAPTAAVAVTLLLARHLLSQIDVPTRQTFLMLAVGDHEREHAAAATNASRTLAQCVSPVLAGSAMASLPLSAPFILGGGLKILYDLLLFAAIRRIEPRYVSETREPL
ncbi:MAG: MFS transporter [Elusimicrobia bacterium]|nr:MFS transporter [Elusimicrobiota bacterium]